MKSFLLQIHPAIGIDGNCITHLINRVIEEVVPDGLVYEFSGGIFDSCSAGDDGTVSPLLVLLYVGVRDQAS